MSDYFNGKIAVLTGAGGAIGGEIAKALAAEGVSVAIWDISEEAATAKADEIRSLGGNAIAIQCDVVSKPSVDEALSQTVDSFSTVDFLVNAAGGSHPSTTTTPDFEFFDIEPESMRKIMDLNYLSSVIPSQAVGRVFASREAGAIVNITSIAGSLPATRSLTYSNGKAAADSFVRWLAVHMAQTYSPKIRVNGIAPGFMVTNQNRFLLLDEKTQEPTERGRSVIAHVPMSRFGDPAEIPGAALWLLSDQATFVTGAVVPVDGGFTAFCGV